jgi:hypothetical protein
MQRPFNTVLPYKIGVVVANLGIAVNWDALKVESLKGD